MSNIHRAYTVMLMARSGWDGTALAMQPIHESTTPRQYGQSRHAMQVRRRNHKAQKGGAK